MDRESLFCSTSLSRHACPGNRIDKEDRTKQEECLNKIKYLDLHVM